VIVAAKFFVSEARRRPRADINSRKPMNIGRLPELQGIGLIGGRRSALVRGVETSRAHEVGIA
jgi:hypothetical protein